MDSVFQKPGDRIVYEYDFGDSWIHTITLENVLRDVSLYQARCLEGARAAPPEDCGGVPGYEELLEALSDPENPDHEDLLDWAGGWQPEAFDVDFVNMQLTPRRVRPPSPGGRAARRG
jgi:hypothetical protein